EDVAKKDAALNSIIEEAIAEKKAVLAKKMDVADARLKELADERKAFDREREEFQTDKIAFLDKQAAPLLKPAVTLLSKGFTDAARERFEKIVSMYPGTPTAKLAQSYLDKMDILHAAKTGSSS